MEPIVVYVALSIPATPPERGDEVVVGYVDRGYGTNIAVRTTTIYVKSYTDPQYPDNFSFGVRVEGRTILTYRTYAEAIDAAIRQTTDIAKEVGYSVALRQERRRTSGIY